MLDDLTIGSESSPEGVLHTLTTAEETLNQISLHVPDQQCANNSPAGHHDVEAFGESPTFCHTFKLGCPHPLIQDANDELKDDVLIDCAKALHGLGILTAESFERNTKRVEDAQRELWQMDQGRRKSILLWGNSIASKQNPESLVEFSRFLDEKYRETQNRCILEKMAAVIEMKAAILYWREQITNGKLPTAPNLSKPSPVPIGTTLPLFQKTMQRITALFTRTTSDTTELDKVA